ncbi:MAG: nucleoside deaminase [Peptoniphilaceae bacterium]|nr:nucleoside deaminase [Peptoniphilaceae bacterium]MDY5765465.1 nucleoside deaminase [Peptoniphilaceae bacterium]
MRNKINPYMWRIRKLCRNDASQISPHPLPRERYRREGLLKAVPRGPKGKKKPQRVLSISQRVVDHFYMDFAYREAERAARNGEVPVGAVYVQHGIRIGFGNRVEREKKSLAHAEMLCLIEAQRRYGRILPEGRLYVTLEPCAMCAGAIVQSHLKRVIFGAWDAERGACGSMLDVLGQKRSLFHVSYTGGIQAERCRKLLQNFFRRRRLLII